MHVIIIFDVEILYYTLLHTTEYFLYALGLLTNVKFMCDSLKLLGIVHHYESFWSWYRKVNVNYLILSVCNDIMC